MKPILTLALLALCCTPRSADAACASTPAVWAQATSPFYMAVASSGNVYVTNDVTNAVAVYSSAGNLLSDWSVAAGSSGPFTPAGVAVDAAGNVYVADYSNSRIVVLNSSGQYQRSLSNPGTGAGQFLIPLDIALGPNSDIFIVDLYPANSKVLRLRLDGTFLNEWAIVTQNGSYDIAVDNDGSVYGVEWPGQTPVQVFSSTGASLRSWSPVDPGVTASTDRIEAHNGIVYVSLAREAAGGPFTELRMFDGFGTLKCTVGAPPLGAIAAGPSRALYIGSPDQGEVFQMTVDSTPVRSSTWGELKSRYR